MINTARVVGGEVEESSYYAGEGGTYEIKRLGDHDERSRKFGNGAPKSIDTESFPSSVGMV